MLIHHCAEASNVKDGSVVIDPSKIRHVTVKAGRIEEMSGYIDQLTHLNLDFSDHKVSRCIISEKFEKGAGVRFCDYGFAFAVVPKSAFNHFGSVDSTQRLLDMRESIKAMQKEKTKAGER